MLKFQRLAEVFPQDERGGVSLDWVVLSAAVMILSMAVLWPIFAGEGNILDIAVKRIAWAVAYDWQTGK